MDDLLEFLGDFMLFYIERELSFLELGLPLV